MRLPRIITHRLQSLFRRGRIEEDLEREIDLHLEQLTKELMAAGMSPNGASIEARRQFGAAECLKEQCRDTRRVNFIEDFIRDVIIALRSYRKSPAFALTAIISLALGVG